MSRSKFNQFYITFLIYRSISGRFFSISESNKLHHSLRWMSHKNSKRNCEFRVISCFFRQPAHIRIHAQMHLAGTSLCQRCLLPDEIPSAPSKHHKVSAFRRTIQCFLSNIGKTVLIVKRKTCVLELRHFKVNQILFLFQ